MLFLEENGVDRAGFEPAELSLSFGKEPSLRKLPLFLLRFLIAFSSLRYTV
jgi:hypothetical protein